MSNFIVVVIFAGFVGFMLGWISRASMDRVSQTSSLNDNLFVTGIRCYGTGPHKDDDTLNVVTGITGRKMLFCASCKWRYERLLLVPVESPVEVRA